MPPISVMIKPVSGACNMRCAYCFYADEMVHREQAVYKAMSPELLDTVVRRIIRYAEGSAHFMFQGGEPTLAGLSFFEELVRLQRKYSAGRLRITNAVQSNGYDVPDEMIEFFAREHFLLGISLDGDALAHDRMRIDARGEGTHAKILNTLERLKRAGVEFNVLCVVNKHVAERPDEIYDALAPYGFVQFIPCLDGLDGDSREYSLTQESYLAFLKATFYRYVQAFDKGQPVSIRNFDNAVSMLMGMPPENCAMVGHCSRNFLIESDGSVYPCDFYALDSWKLGNLATDSLHKIARSEVGTAFIEESLPVPEDCKVCPHYPLCRNGCKRERGEGGKTRWCAVHKAFYDFALPDLQRMAQQLKNR